MMNKAALLSATFGLFSLLALNSCGDSKTQKTYDLSVGIPKQPSSALVHIALHKGFFEDAGLDITPHYYPSGKRALTEGLVTGKVQISTTSDIPFVWKSLEHDKLRILSTIYTANNVNRIIARKDSGIEKPSELSGKKVATQQQSAVHYFLHRFLLEHEIQDEVKLSFYKAELLVEKLHSGEIDAFSMREPYISRARDLLGKENAVIFSSPGLYLQSEILLTTADFSLTNPEVVKAFIKALKQAELFAQTNRQESIDIVSAAIDADKAQINAIWDTFILSVTLEHTLLKRLDEMAYWMTKKRENKKPSKLPDYRQFIDSSPLRSVSAESVLLIE